MMIASLASTNTLINMRPPSANVCPGGQCNATANATALRAKCAASSKPLESLQKRKAPEVMHETAFPRLHQRQLWEISNNTGERFCSPFGNTACVTISLLGDFNFTSSYSNECHQAFEAHKEDRNSPRECPPGDFAIITGAWSSTNANLVHQVDCHIQYGHVQMVQVGDGSPDLHKASFVVSSRRIPRDISRDMSQPYNQQREYLEGQSLWTFASTMGSSDGSPIAPYIMGTANGHSATALVDDPQRIADTVEASFDMATRLAFARTPRSAYLHISTATGHH